MNKLPPELLARVIRPAEERDDVATLSASSLVSRYWYSIVTPLLFRRVAFFVVPLDRQVAEVRRARKEPNDGVRIHTLLHLFTFLLFHPSLSGHIRDIRLQVALPSDTDDDNDPIHPSFALDPRSVLAILSSLPAVRNVRLKNVLFSRLVTEIGRYSSHVGMLVIDFPASWDSRMYTETIETILDVFQGADKLIIVNLHDHGEPEGGLQMYTKRPVHFRCSELALFSGVSIRSLFATVCPCPGTLTNLRLHSGPTLDWLTAALTPHSQSLRSLVCDINLHALRNLLAREPLQHEGKADLRPAAFLANGQRWASLGVLAVHFFISPSLFPLTWRCAHRLLQSLSPSTFPSLRRIFLLFDCLDTESTDVTAELRSFNDASLSRTVDEKLHEMADKAAFRDLCLCLQDGSADDQEPYHHNPSYDNVLRETFPSLHAHGLLSTGDPDRELFDLSMNFCDDCVIS